MGSTCLVDCISYIDNAKVCNLLHAQLSNFNMFSAAQQPAQLKVKIVFNSSDCPKTWFPNSFENVRQYGVDEKLNFMSEDVFFPSLKTHQ